MQLVCTQTQDITNNKSTISWTLSTIGGSNSFYSTGPTKVYINGTEVYSIERKSYTTQVFPASKGSVSGTHTVAHNADGSKSITVSFSTAIYDQNVKTYSASWTLDKIPRAAQINSISSFTDENTPTITYTNYVGNSATSVEAYIYANDAKTLLVGAKELSKTGTSYTYALTDAERNTLRNAAKNTKSLPVKFYLRTLISGVEYWSSAYNINMSIVNAIPQAAINFHDSNAVTADATQDSSIFIRYMSHLTYDINATAYKGASIYGYGVYIGSKSASTAEGTITYVDGDELTLVVTDTRGNEYRETIPLTMIDYVPLTCSQELSIELIEETEAVITCNISGNYYNGDFGGNDNVLRLYCRIAEGNGEFGEWEYIGTARNFGDNTYSSTHHIDGLAYDKSYTVEISAQDLLTSVSSGGRSVALIPVFDWSATDFNFNVPIKMKGNEVGLVAEQGTKDGWYYRKWNNGICEAWKMVEHTTAIDTAWGSLYYGTNIGRQTYPFPYKSKPVETVTMLCGGASAWIVNEGGGVNNGNTSGVYSLVRPTTCNSSTFYVNYYVYGELL